MVNMKIAMIGAGAFGRALGGVLTENGYEVDFYDVQLEKPLAKVLEGAERMLLCVPSGAVGELMTQLPHDLPLVVATKGLLGRSEFAGFSDVMVVSGPGFAEEIKAHRETILTATDERVVEMLATDYLKLELTNDVAGVLLCGALKNVYALLAGWLGLVQESAEWEDYITEVAEEMQALISANGGDPETVNLACGIGDLRLTCGLPSRNYEFGQKLRQDETAVPDKTVEGWVTLARIRRGEIVVPAEARRLNWLVNKSTEWRQMGEAR